MSASHHNRAWATASLKRRDLDNWRCQSCGRAGRLEVHHVEPLRDGGTHAMNNLRTLCRGCHIAIHRQPQTPNQQAWARLIEELRCEHTN